MLVSIYLSVKMLLSLCIPLFLGMLPLHGSSASDPEKKLEELHMNLKKQVTCSICLDTYTEPKTISCLHTFCCECLERHARVSQKQGKFRCPECQVEIDLPEGNRFDCLPNSFFHKSLLSVLQGEDRKGELLSIKSLHKNKWNKLNEVLVEWLNDGKSEINSYICTFPLRYFTLHCTVHCWSQKKMGSKTQHWEISGKER